MKLDVDIEQNQNILFNQGLSLSYNSKRLMECFDTLLLTSQLKPTNKKNEKKCGKVNLPPDVLFGEPWALERAIKEFWDFEANLFILRPKMNLSVNLEGKCIGYQRHWASLKSS